MPTPPYTATYQRLVDAFRRLLHDEPETFIDTLPCDGATTRFEFSVEFVDDRNCTVSLSNPTAVLVNNVDYVIDTRNGVVNMGTAPAGGRNITLAGTRFREFEAEDVEYYIDTAFLEHTHGVVPPMVIDSPAIGQQKLPPIEERVVALAASLLAIQSLIVDAAQDYNILTPDSVQIPFSQRYTQLLQLAAVLEKQYTDLAANLNVGLGRIEQFNLRRESLYTRRLIPEYVEREYDERGYPQRLLPPVDVSVRVVTFQGDWSSTTAYAVDDLVDFKNQRYIAIAPGTNLQPDLNPSDWQPSDINTGWGPTW